MDTEQAEEKKNSRREKQHEQNRIENDEKVENLLREDESDGEYNSGWMTGSCTAARLE